MVSLVLKAASLGLVIYGLTLSARSGLNKATLRRRKEDEPAVGA